MQSIGMTDKIAKSEDGHYERIITQYSIEEKCDVCGRDGDLEIITGESFINVKCTACTYREKVLYPEFKSFKSLETSPGFTIHEISTRTMDGVYIIKLLVGLTRGWRKNAQLDLMGRTSSIPTEAGRYLFRTLSGHDIVTAARYDESGSMAFTWWDNGEKKTDGGSYMRRVGAMFAGPFSCEESAQTIEDSFLRPREDNSAT